MIALHDLMRKKHLLCKCMFLNGKEQQQMTFELGTHYTNGVYYKLRAT